MTSRTCGRRSGFLRVIACSLLTTLAGATAASAQSAARVGSFVKVAGTGPVAQVVPHNLGQTPSALLLWTEGRTDEAFSNAAGVAFRAATSAGAASGVLSLTLAVPAGVQVNDTLLAGIAVSANTPTITAPAGWTLVRRTNNTNNTANALAVYRHVVAAGDPGTYTWTFSASTGSAGTLAAFSGVDLQDPIDVENGQANNSSINQQAPSVTTTGTNEMVVTFHAIASAVTWTPPAGMTAAAEAASGAPGANGESIVTSYVTQAAIAASGTKTATASGNADRGVGHILALRPANPNYFGIGMTDGTNSGSVSTSMQHGTAPPDGARRVARKVLTIAKWDTTVLAEADLQSWNATTFTLNWTTNDTSSYIVHYLAIGGTGVQARVVNWQMATAVGAQTVSGFGFQPTSVIHIHGNSGLTGAPPATTAAGGFGMGAVDAAGNQWATSTFSALNSPTDTQRGQLTDATIHAVNNALSVTKDASFTGWTADGFSLNYTTASALAGQVFTLGLRGVNVRAGNFNKTTAAAPATQAITGLGFQPQAILLHSFQDIARATPVAHARFALGASDGSVSGSGTPIASSSAYTDSDAVSPSYVQGVSKISRAFIKVNNATSTIDAEATVATIESNGFTLNWSTNDAVATQVLYLAFAPLAPTEVRLLTFDATRYDRGTLLRWKTGYEVNNLGFRLYRERQGVRTRVNATPVAGSGLLAGAGTAVNAEQSYAYWDTDPAAAADGTTYWLEDLDFNGTTTLHGPVTPTAGGASAPVAATLTSADLGQLGRRGRPHRVFLRRDDTVLSSMRTLASSPASNLSPLAAQRAIAAGRAVKIGVSATGWYRVSQPELLAAGLAASVDPRTLQLYADGMEQAVRVTGEGDGRLDAADSLEFFGVGLDTRSTDTRVYWLVAGASRGRRMATRVVPPPARPGAPTSFWTTVRRKERGIYFAALLNGDHENWFGPLVSAEPLPVSLASEHRDPGAAAAELEITLQGVTSDSQSAADHRVRVTVNGVDVGEMTFDGQTRATQQFAVPATLLVDGANDVVLTAVNGDADLSLVDTLRLSYWHTDTADADQLWLQHDGAGSLTLHGFASPRVRVIDVTTPDTPVEWPGRITAEANGLSAVTVASAPGRGARQLLAFSDLTVRQPAWVRANAPSNWLQAGPGFDYLLVTDTAFAAAASPLVALRQQQGYKAAVVDIEDVYDETSFGEKRADALKSFLRTARTAWTVAPRVVVLLGDATIDPRDYAQQGAADFVPSIEVDMVSVSLTTASDEAISDFDGDGLADIPIGRLSARTAAQAAAIVDKLVAFDSAAGQPWQRHVLLVADENDETSNFEQFTDRLAPHVPAGWTTRRIDRGGLGAAAAHSALIDEVNAGQAVVNFAGHGSVQLWGREGDLLNGSQVASLWQNGGRLPFVIAMNCLNGLFTQVWDEESLAESLQRAPAGGAIAVWASSAVTSSATQAVVNEELFRLLFSGTAATLGDAIAAARRIIDSPDVRRSWIFFGDPATRLAGIPAAPARPAPAPEPSPIVPPPAGPDDQSTPPAEGEEDSATLDEPAVNLRAPDLDGDGRADVLTYAADSGRWLASLSRAAGTAARERSGAWWPAVRPLAADLDGDGRDEIVLVSHDARQWWIASPLTGAVTALAEQDVVLPDAQLLAGDMTGDGRADVLAYDRRSGTLLVGRGTTRGGLVIGRASLSAGLRLHLAAGLVIGYDDRTGLAIVARAERNGTIATVANADWGLGWRITVLGGERRGDISLLAYDRQDGRWEWRVLNARGWVVKRSGTWSSGLTLVAADLDGDGQQDVVGYDRTNGQWLHAVVAQASGPRLVASGTWTPGWQLAIGDLDGDRRDDAVLVDPQTGVGLRALTLAPGAVVFEATSSAPGAALVGVPR